MRPAPNALIEMYRVRQTGARTSDAGNNGAFRVPFRKAMLNVICSDGGSWDHVSVSLPDRCPSWEEMCHIKELFFCSEETVIQFHPPKSLYINNHPFCLHLWRPQNATIELPPACMVGVAGVAPNEAALDSLKIMRKAAKQAGLEL